MGLGKWLAGRLIEGVQDGLAGAAKNPFSPGDAAAEATRRRRERHQPIGRTAVRSPLGHMLDSQGKLVHTSGQWTHGDLTFAVKPSDDPSAPGGYFMSISWPHPSKPGNREHTSIVFDADGYVADTASNRKNGWVGRR